jgi:hypothetical protein
MTQTRRRQTGSLTHVCEKAPPGRRGLSVTAVHLGVWGWWTAKRLTRRLGVGSCRGVTGGAKRPRRASGAKSHVCAKSTSLVDHCDEVNAVWGGMVPAAKGAATALFALSVLGP